MIPGISASKVDHTVAQPRYGFGIWRTSTATDTPRIDHFIATDGSTIAMLSYSNSLGSTKAVYYSTDYGNTWNLPPGTPPTGINAIRYLDGKWCALTASGAIYYSTQIASVNWSTWSIGGTTGKTACQSLAFDPDATHKWVIGDQEAQDIYYSSTINGTFSTITGINNQEAVVSGRLNNQVVWAFGRPNGEIVGSALGGDLSSTSATTLLNGSPNQGVRSLMWTPGLWVLGGEAGQLWTSPDTGTNFTWTSRTSGYDATHDCHTQAYANGIYYCGAYPTGAGGTKVTGQISISLDPTNGYSRLYTSATNAILGGYGRGAVVINGSVKFSEYTNTLNVAEESKSGVLSHNYAKR